MSGIAGVIRFDGGPVESAHVRGMTDAMVHRGPDGIAVRSAGSAALGHCMLRTTPESLEERQPLANDDESAVLVMDGRVDNWEELRADLLAGGARLRSGADAELVLRAWERWGHDCVEHIDGDFALVIWDSVRREAFCARDRQAARPFHYHCDGDRFSFASELHALLALPWVSEDLNEGMIAEILECDELSHDETLWRGISRLPAAHRMRVDRTGWRTSRYWTPALKPEIRYRRDADYIEHIRELVFDAVRRLSRHHGVVGCEVSGGLDSSGVFAVADRLLRSGRLPAKGLVGYSLDFADGSDADEIDYARAVARHVDREVREIPPALVPLDWYRDWAGRYRDFPHYPNTVMSHGIHRAVRAAGGRVLLTGFGGDEWSMGSDFYHADFMIDLDPGGLARAFARDRAAFGLRCALYRSLRFGPFALLPRPLQNLAKRLRGMARPARGSDWRFRLHPRIEALMAERRARYAAHLPRGRRPRHDVSFDHLLSPRRAQARESMNHLSAAAGIETRDPLTATPLIDFHFRTPERLRGEAGQHRLLQRAAFRGLLPEPVRTRRRKAEFSVTLRRHLDDLSVYDDGLIERAGAAWVRPGEVAAMLERARLTTNYGMAKWAIWGLFGCAAVVGRV